MTRLELSSLTVYDIKNILTVRKRKNETFHSSCRQLHGISIVSSGSYVYTQDGRSVPSDTTHVIYLPKFARYDLRCVNEDMSYVINFECSSEETRLCAFPVDCGAELLRDARRMLACTGRLARLSAMYALLDRVASNVRRPRIDGAVREAVRYFNESFCDPSVSLAEAARAAGISPVYLRRLFHSAYGMPPMKYVHNLRMTRAKLLLCERELSVEKIAAACGYSSLYSFSSAFRRSTGLPPTGYVREYGGI